jgi:hypothetical protein
VWCNHGHRSRGRFWHREFHDECCAAASANLARGAQIANTFRAALLAREDGEIMTTGTLTEPEGLDGSLRVGADYVTVIRRKGC